MRHSPLNAALASQRLESSKSKLNCSEKSAFSVQIPQFGFRVFLDTDLVESIECLAVSRSLKAIKSRCFKVVGCSTRKVWFHKRLYHCCDLAFFVADS